MIWKVIICSSASVLWLWIAANNLELIPNIDWLSLPLIALAFVFMPGIVWWGAAKLTRLL